jgi:hypothetical protein
MFFSLGAIDQLLLIGGGLLLFVMIRHMFKLARWLDENP